MLRYMMLAGMFNDPYGKRITYGNGNDSKLAEANIKVEYELIKQKKSELPANVRLKIVRHVERGQ
jgi:hypothetical protein